MFNLLWLDYCNISEDDHDIRTSVRESACSVQGSPPAVCDDWEWRVTGKSQYVRMYATNVDLFVFRNRSEILMFFTLHWDKIIGISVCKERKKIWSLSGNRWNTGLYASCIFNFLSYHLMFHIFHVHNHRSTPCLFPSLSPSPAFSLIHSYFSHLPFHSLSLRLMKGSSLSLSLLFSCHLFSAFSHSLRNSLWNPIQGWCEHSGRWISVPRQHMSGDFWYTLCVISCARRCHAMWDVSL